MDFEEYRTSLVATEPPPHLNLGLQALWWDAKGDWERAHDCVQSSENDATSAWVHAYLHRKEGDLSNAAYWYRRGSQPVASGAFDAEWSAIAASLLKPSGSVR